MKRSRLGVGKKSQERGSTFARGVSPPGGPSDRERRAAWAHGGRSKTCAVCGARGVEGHHIVYQQRIRRAARTLGLDVDRLLFDTRNRLWLCRRHHAAAHARSHPIAWALLERHAPKVFQFAREIDELPWLERMYPRNQREEQHDDEAAADTAGRGRRGAEGR